MTDLKVKGEWFIRLYSANQLKKEISGHNVITTDGVSFLASYLNSAAAAAATFTMKYIAIGTDATAENSADTALGSESARTTGTVSNVTGAIYQVKATFPSGTGTGAIVEYGLLSSSSAGTMLSRDTESVVNKGANDELQVTTQITCS